MAQTFTKGQRVKVYDGRWNGWIDATVINPDIRNPYGYPGRTRSWVLVSVGGELHPNENNVPNAKNLIRSLDNYKEIETRNAAVQATKEAQKVEEAKARRRDRLYAAGLILDVISSAMGNDNLYRSRHVEVRDRLADWFETAEDNILGLVRR